MEPNLLDGLSIFSVVFMLFGLVIAILWFLLPFAVFGVKKRLDEANRHLAEIQKELHAQNRGPSLNPSPSARDRVEPSLPMP